jgi:hypothetical protein
MSTDLYHVNKSTKSTNHLLRVEHHLLHVKHHLLRVKKHQHLSGTTKWRLTALQPTTQPSASASGRQAAFAPLRIEVSPTAPQNLGCECFLAAMKVMRT